MLTHFMSIIPDTVKSTIKSTVKSTVKSTITIFIAFWSICDDAILTRWSGFATVIMITAAGLLLLAALTRRRAAFALPVLLIAAAMSVSWAYNRDLSPAIVQFIFYAAGIGAMYTAAWLGGDVIKRALFWAGPVWLAGVMIAWAAGIHINRNIIAFWPVIWIVATLERPGLRKWTRLGILAVYAAVILWSDSRGAMLAAAVALLVYHPPDFQSARQRIAAGVLSTGLFGVLVIASPRNSAARLYYWSSSLRAMWQHNPLFGLGPGGILARGVMQEPGEIWNVPHAHNILIHHTAELGLLGLAALVAIAVWCWRRRAWLDRWQLAVLAGVMTHSMVDHPLFYFSPLVVVLMIVGTIEKGKEHADGQETIPA